MTTASRIALVLLFALLAACATTGAPVDQARQLFEQGRGEEALALLQKAHKADPHDQAVRGEYYRLRDLLAAQWLAQAETLRQAGHFEAAENLYRRIQNYDPASTRADAFVMQV